MTKDKVPKSKIPQALDALRALGARELDDIPARAAIRKMRRQIERVLRLGYTYEDVSKTLAGLDINISPERIRYLLNDIRRSTRKTSGNKSSSESSNPQVIDGSALVENSAVTVSNNRSVNGRKSSSTPAQSGKSNSPASTTTKQLDSATDSEYQYTSRPAFIPQLIDDEDL